MILDNDKPARIGSMHAGENSKCKDISSDLENISPPETCQTIERKMFRPIFAHNCVLTHTFASFSSDWRFQNFTQCLQNGVLLCDTSLNQLPTNLYSIVRSLRWLQQLQQANVYSQQQGAATSDDQLWQRRWRTQPRVQEDHGTDGRHPDHEQVCKEGRWLIESGRDDRGGEKEQGVQQDYWTVQRPTTGKESFSDNHIGDKFLALKDAFPLELDIWPNVTEDKLWHLTRVINKNICLNFFRLNWRHSKPRRM